MNITVVGVGDVGTALAPLFAAAGHQVLLASRRSRQGLAEHGLAELLSRPNVAAGPVRGSADSADLVLLSVPYGGAEAALTEVGTWPGGSSWTPPTSIVGGTGTPPIPGRAAPPPSWLSDTRRPAG